MSMVGHIVFYYIPSEWASALLILFQRQCEGQIRGISKVADSRASFLYTLQARHNINGVQGITATT